MADSAQEKTEKATPRKIRKAREEGQVARSTELNSVVIISFGFVTLYLLGPMIFNSFASLMRHTFIEAPRVDITMVSVKSIFASRIMTYAAIIGPLLMTLAIFSYLINASQTGLLFTMKALAPKMDKFNLAKGFKRLISKRSLIEMCRDIIKIILISIVSYQTIAGWVPDLMMLGDATAGQFGSILGKLALILAIKISVVLLILALFDFAFQRFDYASNLKMTKQEIREEMKDTEGNPHLKGRIKQVQREMARRRMMSEIPKADVVVTNPTHIAVALKYDSSEMPAPMVLAKGQRLIAERIKEIAREHHIPIVENKPLARSLFKMVDIGGYIPLELYRAVAEILAYIYRIKENVGVSRG
jgi:flagellar biosynthetic protein FlhB